jgi:microcystin-dependent protein
MLSSVRSSSSMESVMEPFIGQIMMFGGNFAPRGWAFCNGQVMSIAQNTALFSLLGTTYGGDGITTFALPNLMGRVPMHWGNGAGLSPRQLGESGGQESVTLLLSQLPSHTHAIALGSTGPGNGAGITGGAPSETATGATQTGPTGVGAPVATMMPHQCVTFVIALEGIYPSRG